MAIGAVICGSCCAVCSIIGVGFVAFVLDLYFYLHNFGVYGIVKRFQDHDTLSLVNSLPYPLYERNISNIVETPEVYYIYTSKYAGKSTIGKLISIESAKKHIPFLYAHVASEISPHAACLSLGKQIGYYPQKIPYYYRILGSHNDYTHPNTSCHASEIVDSIGRAVDS